MKALYRIRGVTNKDINQQRSFEMTGFVDLDKLQLRLRWFGHVNRRENDYALKSADCVSVPGKRPAGRRET